MSEVKTPSPPPAAKPPAPPTPSPKPEPIRAKELAAAISSRFPSTKLEYAREKRLKVSVPLADLKDAALFIRDSLGFDHLKTVSAADWLAKGEFEVVYFAGSVSKPGFEDFILALSVFFPRSDPVVPTLSGVWLAADYGERETHEMFGINFQGHPNNAHLFLPEDWNDLPPLRKDYNSPGR